MILVCERPKTGFFGKKQVGKKVQDVEPGLEITFSRNEKTGVLGSVFCNKPPEPFFCFIFNTRGKGE